MTDNQLIERFENCTLPPESFPHREHVRLAWLYLHNHSTLEALAKFCVGLKRFSAALGKAERYHETVTWAYLLLIRERMARTEETGNWKEFALANPDLLDWQTNVLKRYYREETLNSAFAKQVFILPDKAVPASFPN